MNNHVFFIEKLKNYGVEATIFPMSIKAKKSIKSDTS